MEPNQNAEHLAKCERLLQEAESFEKAGDWEKAVAKYRELNDLDHLYKGAEAKLLFALTERDAGRLYAEGKAHMAANRYAEALEAFRKTRQRAGVYKDTAALIKECEGKLAGAVGGAAPTGSPARRGCLGLLLTFLRT